MSVTIPLELRFLSIPISWTRRKDLIYGDHALVPEVNQGRRAKPIENAHHLRNEFLRMEHSEEAALKFLEQVGVWDVSERANWDGANTIQGDYGYRYVINPLYPVALTIEELWDEQERWNELLKEKNRAKLIAKFGPPPGEGARPGAHSTFAFDAYYSNTLQMHLECKRHPLAIIQPITGRELLIAAAWVDIARGSEFQVCQNPTCGISFTYPHKRKYCPGKDEGDPSPCAHRVAQRAHYWSREQVKKRAMKKKNRVAGRVKGTR